jgi:hypothetical protein
MNDYELPEERQNEGKPHPDSGKNFLYSSKKLWGLFFKEDVKVELQKKNQIPLCCLFVYGTAARHSYWISFHQNAVLFNTELSDILNHMRQNGLIKTPLVDADDKWG